MTGLFLHFLIYSCPYSRQERWGSARFSSFHEVRPLIMDRDRLPTGTPHPELVPTPPILSLQRYSALRDFLPWRGETTACKVNSFHLPETLCPLFLGVSLDSNNHK